MSEPRADPPAAQSQPTAQEGSGAPTADPSAPSTAEPTTAPLAGVLEAQEPTGETTSDDTSDSALGSEYDESQYTASLTSSIESYQFQHGRRYHAYQAGRYDLPNDEQEQERMDLQYHSLRLAYGDKLYFSPLPENPSKILDIGTGTGIWVIDMAEHMPNTDIIGTDLSPIQPKWVPPNAKFEVDDAEQPWTFPEAHFDMVHCRIMNAFVRDWDNIMSQAYRHLKPGGWIELQELSVDVKSDDNSLPADSHITQWAENEDKAWKQLGCNTKITGEEIKGWMEKAGFVNIEVKAFKIPIGTWPKDKQLRETGAFQLVAMLEGIQGLTIAPWVRHLGWREEEVEVFIAKVRNEWKTRSVHTYFPLYAVYGQKPQA